MNILRRIRILPVLIIVAGLAFTIRAGEFVTGLKGMGDAMAQEQVDAEVPPLPDNAAIEENMEAAAEEAGADTGEGGRSILDLSDEDIDWRDATESEYEYSETQREIYMELSQRRADLKEREKSLARQAALLEAAERELDQKLRELTSIQREIEGLLEQQSAEEKARIQSLVKIYEGMKAKDAARIFNTLDVDVLMRVMSRMSERKSAPILAEMNPERARTVTILLAQQQQLPGVSP